MNETFLHNKKIALLILFIIFIFSICIIYTSQNRSNLLITSGLIILCLPYIIPFVIFGGHSNKQKYLDPLWIKIALLIFFSIYVALSRSWSSSIVNNTFQIPASNLPITTALINIAYLPYNFFGYFLEYLFIIILLLTPFLPALLFLKKDKQTLKYFIYSIFFSIYVGFSMSSITFMTKNNDYIIKMLALKLDFDSKNNCIGFNQDNYKVVHIGNGKIMVFNSNKQINAVEQFKIHDCINL